MPRQSFEEIVLPHLDAAFNYARWLTRSEVDAEDVVQDAYMRAFKFFSSFRGEDARAWLLTIVRNTWYGRFPRGAGRLPMSSIDETGDGPLDEGLDPEALLMQRQTVVVGIPIGTVMSRLARGRERLLGVLGPNETAGGRRAVR